MLHWHFVFCALASFMFTVMADDHPVDVINGRQFEGHYTVSQSGQTFNYLDGREGRLIAIFYGQPNRDSINSVNLFLMDPRYWDSKGIVDIGDGDKWVNASHRISYTTLWKEHEIDDNEIDNVSTEITFTNLNENDYESVKINLHMKGNSFQFTVELTYFNEIVSTLTYSLYVGVVVLIQIYSGYMLLKIMDAPNFVFCAKLSLVTLSICTIQDFSQTMDHIQYIMNSHSGYYFFILPSLGYLVLFLVIDMKMMFLVWRSHNLRNLQNPQTFKKKLTVFYIQFYLGLCLYLTLTYFFNTYEWMVVLCNLWLIPQIIHNVRLGNNPGFNYYYIFGFVGARLLLPIYERLCPENRFSLTPHVALVVVLISLFVVEVILLYFQSKCGSRFFVPKRFQPNYFNYKKKLRLDEDNKDNECSICLQNVFESTPHTNLNTSQLESSLIEQAIRQEEITVMSTPCNHIFHEECLSQWMEVKLECPTCRTELPPL